MRVLFATFRHRSRLLGLGLTPRAWVLAIFLRGSSSGTTGFRVTVLSLCWRVWEFEVFGFAVCGRGNGFRYHVGFRSDLEGLGRPSWQ